MRRIVRVSNGHCFFFLPGRSRLSSPSSSSLLLWSTRTTEDVRCVCFNMERQLCAHGGLDHVMSSSLDFPLRVSFPYPSTSKGSSEQANLAFAPPFACKGLKGNKPVHHGYGRRGWTVFGAGPGRWEHWRRDRFCTTSEAVAPRPRGRRC